MSVVLQIYIVFLIKKNQLIPYTDCIDCDPLLILWRELSAAMRYKFYCVITFHMQNHGRPAPSNTFQCTYVGHTTKNWSGHE